MHKQKRKLHDFESKSKALVIVLCILLSFFLMFCGVEHKNIFLGLFSIVISWQTGLLSLMYISEQKNKI